MEAVFYGQIDLTKLGVIARQHKELIKKVNFKDGEHQLLNVQILAKDTPDKYGNVACVKASCKRDQERLGVNYYVGDLKDSGDKPRPQSFDKDEPAIEYNNLDLPF